jgi:hypothetical protein
MDLNQAADDISKAQDVDDYMLNPRYFAVLDPRSGPHTADLFASNFIAHCGIFFSKHKCDGTLGVIEIEIEIVYNNTKINRLLSLGPPCLCLVDLFS